MSKFKNHFSLVAVFITAVFIFFSCNNDDDNVNASSSARSYFAVANRGSNTITYHNTQNLNLLGTTNLPDGTQPTYVVYSAQRNKLYTGGLESGILYEINADNFLVERSIQVGLGAFHLWLNDTSDQLWVNNINGAVKTTTVVDLNSFAVEQTLPLPATLGLSSDAVQHDVIINPAGTFAYVTILDGEDTSHLVQYNTSDFSIVNTETFGGDGHVGFFNNELYTLSQNAGEIKALEPSNLSERLSIPFMGSHGVTASNEHLFAADLPGGRIGVIAADGTIVSTTNTNFSATHNLSVTAAGDKVLVTYSGGTQTKVELFDVNNGELTLNATADSGTNPFGVVFVQQ